MFSLSSFRKKAYSILEKRGILLAGIFIFGYYLWSTIDMFATFSEHRAFQGYFLHFNSLILLWLLLFLGVRLSEHKKKQKEEHESNRKIALDLERQKMRLDLLDEITALMSDAINNPLAVISVSVGSIRERFASDDEALGFLDRIDAALKRMREVLIEFEGHHTKRIIKSTMQNMKFDSALKNHGQ